MSDESKTAQDAAPETVATDAVVYHDRPAGWKHKSFRIFGRELWYASPKVQLIMISFVCFLCPGMYNSLTGLGGAGQVDPSVQNKASTGLYSTFAVVGFFAGTITNWLGLRPALALGGLGYCIYAASFLSFNHNENEGFVIFAGTFLGVCAGLLWCAQGAIMMSYPPEEKKGRYISWFWVIFNLGAVIGALVRNTTLFFFFPFPPHTTRTNANRFPLVKTSKTRVVRSMTVLTSPSSSSCSLVPSSPCFSATPTT